MYAISKGAPMGYSTVWPLDNSRDQQVYLELLDETNIDVLHTLHVHPIRNQFWQFSLCNFYRLWQPDEFLLGLVKDILHWLLKYLEARNVKDQFDNWFTSVPQYPDILLFSKSFDSMKSSYWEGKEIWGMIRTLPVISAPIPECFHVDRKTVAETASDEMAMGAVPALCAFSLLVSQQNRSDQSLTALDDAVKRFQRWFPSKRRIYRSLHRPKWINSWKENPISYENHRFIKSMLQLRFRCTGLKRLLHQNKGNFRCTWMEPDHWQPNRQMLIGWG